MLNADCCDWLFISRKGNRLSHRTAEEHFAKVVKEASPFFIDNVTPHLLRHAFASHAFDGNADILVVKAIMGHASLRTTEIYHHPSKETLRKAINNLLVNDLLQKAVQSYRDAIRVNHRKVRSG